MKSRYFVTPSECFTKEIFPGVDISTLAGQHAMLSIVKFKPKAVVQPHSHPHEQFGVLLEGELTFIIGEETRTLRAGELWRIPGGVVHSAIAGDSPVTAIDVFQPVREDYTHRD